MEKHHLMRPAFLIGIALVVITASVYWQTGSHGFVNIDDKIYVIDNINIVSGISLNNVVWAFTTTHAANWHPLTWLSHMLDVEMYGLNPRGHHLGNVFFHASSTLLLFLFLNRLTNAPWKSAFVSALFALHPLHVESVAWVAERKDVLSALFWFLTLWSYAEYVTWRRARLYCLALLTFALGLMAKQMLVTLPAIMLLIDFWPLNRFSPDESTAGLPPWQVVRSRLGPLVKEKIPFFLCSLAASAIAIYAQHRGEAIQGLEVLPLGQRLANASTAYLKYLGKTLWPADLAVFYPFPLAVPFWQVAGSLLFLLVVSAAVIRTARHHPYLTVGWFWFLITLLPVIGIVQIGLQSMADRYTYLPLTGLFIASAWGVPALMETVPRKNAILALLASAVVLASTVLTWQQLRHWQDSKSLFQQALRVAPGNSLAHNIVLNNLGLAFAEQGQLDEAIAMYERALELNPQNGEVRNNLGVALETKGLLNEAKGQYLKAIEINRNSYKTLNNLGIVFVRQGALEEAINSFRKAIDIKPDYIDAHFNLGLTYQRKGLLDEAIQQYRIVLAANPRDINAQNKLTQAMERKNQGGHF